jgi:hypothetical protein
VETDSTINDWNSLYPDERMAAEILGYDEDTWEKEGEDRWTITSDAARDPFTLWSVISGMSEDDQLDEFVAVSDRDGTSGKPFTLYATVLFLAVQYSHDDYVEQLLETGADPSRGTSDGLTPLMYAAQRGKLSVVRQLLLNQDSSAATMVDPDGWSALHHAAAYGNAACFVELAKFVPVDVADRSVGSSYTELALQNGHPSVLEALDDGLSRSVSATKLGYNEPHCGEHGVMESVGAARCTCDDDYSGKWCQYAPVYQISGTPVGSGIYRRIDSDPEILCDGAPTYSSDYDEFLFRERDAGTPVHRSWSVAGKEAMHTCTAASDYAILSSQWTIMASGPADSAYFSETAQWVGTSGLGHGSLWEWQAQPSLRISECPASLARDCAQLVASVFFINLLLAGAEDLYKVDLFRSHPRATTKVHPRVPRWLIHTAWAPCTYLYAGFRWVSLRTAERVPEVTVYLKSLSEVGFLQSLMCWSMFFIKFLVLYVDGYRCEISGVVVSIVSVLFLDLMPTKIETVGRYLCWCVLCVDMLPHSVYGYGPQAHVDVEFRYSRRLGSLQMEISVAAMVLSRLVGIRLVPVLLTFSIICISIVAHPERWEIVQGHPINNIYIAQTDRTHDIASVLSWYLDIWAAEWVLWYLPFCGLELLAVHVLRYTRAAALRTGTAAHKAICLCASMPRHAFSSLGELNLAVRFQMALWSPIRSVGNHLTTCATKIRRRCITCCAKKDSSNPEQHEHGTDTNRINAEEAMSAVENASEEADETAQEDEGNERDDDYTELSAYLITQKLSKIRCGRNMSDGRHANDVELLLPRYEQKGENAQQWNASN